MGGTLLRLIILYILLLCSACAGSADETVRPHDPELSLGSSGLPASFELPALPVDALRSVSAGEELSRLGRETYSRDSLAINQLTALKIPAPEGGISWGMWELSPGNQQADVLSLTQQEAGPGTWLALANFETRRWDLSKASGTLAELGMIEGLHLSPGGHVYIAVIASGTDSALVETLELTVKDNLRPQVVLTADPPEGDAPFSVILDASGSFDNDGTIEDFEWDLDGDGLLNEAGAEADARGLDVATLEIDGAGLNTPAVYITDNQGAYSGGGAFISAYGWSNTSISPEESFNAHSHLAQINGFPALSYFNGALGGLYYAWPEGSNLLGAWDSEVVDSAPGAGEGTAMRVFAGNPAIAYIRPDSAIPANGKLCFAYSNDGSNQVPGDWSITEIEVVGKSAPEVDLISIEGNPAIAYYNALDNSLSFAVSDTADGADAEDWASHKVADAPAGERYLSLALIGGNPAIAHTHEFEGGLAYLRSTTGLPDKTIDWQTVVLDETAVAVRCPSLTELGGRPAISYSESPAGNLWYARSSSVDGLDSNDWTLVMVDAASGASLYTSLGEIDGRPAIAYQAGDPRGLRLAESSSANGTSASDWSDRAINSTAGGGAYASLLSINTVPMIAHCSSNGIGGELIFQLLLTAPD